MDTSSPILQLKDVQFSIGATRLFEGLDCVVQPGARICLVGRNGTGKSTIFRLISGVLEPDQGDIVEQPGIRITHMPQDPIFPSNTTALAYVCDQKDATEHEAKKLLDGLGVSYDKSLDELSGGQARRISLAHALVTEPDLLLLDEPTNHLDLASIEWLEGTLQTYPGSFIVISHDRAFLNKVTTETLWLEKGRVRRLRKGYQDFPEWSEAILEEEARSSIKLDKKIEAETDWASSGIKARRKRNQGRLRNLQDMRRLRAQQIQIVKMARLDAGTKELTSRSIIDAQSISKSYGEAEIITEFTTRIMHGDRIGIVGPNGAGKTTLLKMFTGHLKPDTGKLKLAKNLQIAYLDQTRATLDPDKSLMETLCPGGGDMVDVMGTRKHVVAYLKEFLFHPDQARSPVRILSGGEKNRLLLALSLAQESNMLILDEPTNDLDMDTLDRLQDMLMAYEGTLLVVSHDRDFLDNLVSSTIVLEGDGIATEYAGGYSDYLIQKKGQKKRTPKTETKKADKKQPKEKKPTKAKLSFKDQYALKTLPDEIAKIEAAIESLSHQLSDPAIYTKNPDQATQFAKDLADLKDQKEALEHRWLELELLQDSL